MRLNRIEFALMNNPVRAGIQRYFEAPRLRRMGGVLRGGRALEVGCGRGVGTELILELFGADRVDAFDLDPGMVVRARTRLRDHRSRTRLWVGNVCSISAPDAFYDAVFDFGIIHHVLEWRRGLAEIYRVLKPGGRLYAEEALEPFIANPVIRHLLDHPQTDRFNFEGFRQGLTAVGLEDIAGQELWGSFAWFTARRPVET